MISRKKTIFLLLLIMPLTFLPAQYDYSDPSILPEFTQPETRKIPQWLKDLRRWEIITFGVFPFSMFFTTFGVDMVRWSNNGWDRRYAPWPMKSAGAIAMERKETEMTIAIAAGVSIGVSIIDLIIVQIKRAKERKRAEAIPVGTAEITITPYPEDQPQDIPEDIPELPLEEATNSNSP